VTTASGEPNRLTPPLVERRYLLPFALVTTLFLAWALAGALNDVLIRQFQKALDLTRTQSSLVQLAFYLGYFCAGIPAGLVIRRIGYKGAILVGLACYAGGAFLFLPAADAQRFGLFLTALYTIACGLAFLETAANPYVAILGAPQTAAARLNLAQGFAGVGALLGPVIGGVFIFSGVEHSRAELTAMSAGSLAAYRAVEAAMVKGPYLAIGLCVCMLALVTAVTRFPVIEQRTAERRNFFAVLRHRRLLAAVVAQFFYVGAQVGVWSFFIDFSKGEAPSLPERTAALLLSLSLAMLMVGRFAGAAVQRRVAPARLLAFCAAANVLLCFLAASASGATAVAALWLTSLFMSIMYPTIFALGVAGLEQETENGSALLVTSIIGGALIPPLMGLLSDAIGGVHRVMVVPMLCFAVILLFAWRAIRGIDLNGVGEA
jgi:MFS transporter, FHS family, L-fucose permease